MEPGLAVLLAAALQLSDDRRVIGIFGKRDRRTQVAGRKLPSARIRRKAAVSASAMLLPACAAALRLSLET